MKNTLMIISLSLFTVTQFNAQTNTFPTSGNVGIGTTTPIYELNIHDSGSGPIDTRIHLTNNDTGTAWTDGFQMIMNGSSANYKVNLLNRENSDMGFWTNNTERVTITNNGYVGVGTFNPLEKFQIGNTFTFHDGGHKVMAFNYAPSGGVDLSSSQYAAEIRFDPVNGQLRFGTSSSVTNNPTSHLNIDNNGNIGIGTTNLSFAKLQIRGGATHMLFAVNRPNNDVPALYLGNDGSNNAAIASNNSDLTFGKDLSGNYTEHMRIKSTGNIGIGTTTPDAKLAVKGNIHTNEVKVDLLGAVAPDYVFHKDYDLKTLTEVENHIIKKGHLPNIPSAKEMETNGIYLKKMNLKLLEKIEELTLYTIDQEKRINALEQENNMFKKQQERIKLLEQQMALFLKIKE